MLCGQSLSPGNEQREFWGSKAADSTGSHNTLGIKDPAVDELVDQVIAAPDRDSLVTRTHALDRVLLWRYYVIPHWYFARVPHRLLGQVRRGPRSSPNTQRSASTPGGSIRQGQGAAQPTGGKQ